MELKELLICRLIKFFEVKYLACLVITSLLLIACGQKEEEKSMPTTLGKYIYRDDNDIHHINPNCLKLRRGKDDAGHEIYAKHLMDTSNFIIANYEYFRVCTRCVSDKEYEHMLRISEQNSNY